MASTLSKLFDIKLSIVLYVKIYNVDKKWKR